MEKYAHSDKPVVKKEGSVAVSTSSSLVAKTGQIMAIIIGLGLSSMIASMLVTESLSGDAAQINDVGALRLQAMRISRAFLIEKQLVEKKNTDLKDKESLFDTDTDTDTELSLFKAQFDKVFSGGFSNVRENKAIERHYQQILNTWTKFTQTTWRPGAAFFDQFILEIDQLVSLFQLESEKKLRLLRLIQGVSLFSILLVASVVLYQVNRVIITPLRRLMEVAAEVGKGNFELRAAYQEDNELGVLAETINRMSDELKSTYEELEDRVEIKTNELMRSNQSLEVLYHAASNLTNHKFYQTELQIINELESILGFGKVTVERENLKLDNSVICILSDLSQSEQLCLNRLEYPLEKATRRFGLLIWQIPKEKESSPWQTQLLQAMAGIIATAIELEQNRSAEDRLLIAEERAVIARELHDSLAQSLSYLKVQMSLLTRKVQKEVSTAQLSDTINDIKQGLNAAYQQLRELLTTFRLKLEDSSIERALQGTVNEFCAKCNHPIALNVDIPRHSLSANQEIHVLQIVREALSNIYRHACASNAGVSLSINHHKIQVEIWDNGSGISYDKHEPGHLGLSIMRERAKSLGSEISFDTSHQGTRITVTFELIASTNTNQS